MRIDLDNTREECIVILYYWISLIDLMGSNKKKWWDELREERRKDIEAERDSN